VVSEVFAAPTTRKAADHDRHLRMAG
jgi:hypothetical protein